MRGGRSVNPQEITAYLDAPHIALVATIHWNGTPHLTPNVPVRWEGVDSYHSKRPAEIPPPAM